MADARIGTPPALSLPFSHVTKPTRTCVPVRRRRAQVIQKVKFPLVVCFGLVVLFASSPTQAQQDPGPRAGAAAAGSYYPTLSAAEQAVFTNAQETFMEVQSVSAGPSRRNGPGSWAHI